MCIFIESQSLTSESFPYDINLNVILTIENISLSTMNSQTSVHVIPDKRNIIHYSIIGSILAKKV